MRHSELTQTITASGRSAYYVDEVDMLVAQLETTNAKLLEALKNMVLMTDGSEFQHSSARYQAKREIRHAEEQVTTSVVANDSPE